MPPASRKDPWTILGVPRDASIDEIRAQYRRLALSLHPDKHAADLSPEQRTEREERFKEVSVAYQVAMDIAKARENGCDFSNSDEYERWRGMWERVEAMIRNKGLMETLGKALRGTLKDMAINAISRINSVHAQQDRSSDAASDISSDVGTSSSEDAPRQDPEPRIFKLSVSLEEVHTRQARRVRLFLSDHPKDPFFVDVPFDDFPEAHSTHVHSGTEYSIVIRMEAKKHGIYHWDPLLGGWDLYTTVPISLYEYITGCVRPIPCLGASSTNSSPIMLSVPAFPNVKNPIVLEGLGLRNRGNLYVMLDVDLPTKKEWKKLKNEDLEDFLCVCKKLENPNAPHHTPS